MQIKVADFNVEVVYSRRKTIGLTVFPDERVVLRLPYGGSVEDGRRFILEKQDWIRSKLRLAEENMEDAQDAGYLSEAAIRKLGEEAARDLKVRIDRFMPIVGVHVRHVTIRCQRTRWGSFSSAGNLNLNCLLMLTPPEVRDYVVVHELCHGLEMNHSSRFWQEVERVLPNYKTQVAWLKKNGPAIMARVPR